MAVFRLIVPDMAEALSAQALQIPMKAGTATPLVRAGVGPDAIHMAASAPALPMQIRVRRPMRQATGGAPAPLQRAPRKTVDQEGAEPAGMMQTPV